MPAPSAISHPPIAIARYLLAMAPPADRPRNICVYCSSSDRIDRRYFHIARQLGEQIGRHRDTLVWGGGSVGLMGELARAVHAHGGRVVGVIPRALTEVEFAYREADELIVTDDVRQRKAEMERRADAFVVLPGGFGTLEELAEILVLKVLEYTDRPLVLLNVDGFYDPLLALFEHFVEHHFAKPQHLDLLEVVDTVAQIYPALRTE